MRVSVKAKRAAAARKHIVTEHELESQDSFFKRQVKRLRELLS